MNHIKLQADMNENEMYGPSAIWDSILSWISMAAVASYLLFYALIPDAYVFGPAIILLLAVFGFRWRYLCRDVDRQSLIFIGVFLLYFGGQALTLVLHGEDLSEFDLATRYVAAALVLVFVLKYPISTRWFFLLVATGAIMTGVYAVYQFELQGVRRVSAFDNPIHYGNGALALALISVAGMVWVSKQRLRYFYGSLLMLGFFAGVYASLVSGTRSGWVAVPVVLSIWLYAYWRQLVRHKAVLALLLSTVVIGGGIVSQVGMVEARVQVAVEEFRDYFEEGRNNTSVGLRLDMWKAGLVAFRTDPLIGTGPLGTDRVVADLIASGEIHPAVDNFRHLHNQYIDVMARYGIVGLVGYLLLLFVPFIAFVRQSRSDTASVSALGLAGAFFVGLHAVVNLTQSMLERNIGVMMFVFMVVFIWAVLDNEELREKASNHTSGAAQRRELACHT